MNKAASVGIAVCLIWNGLLFAQNGTSSTEQQESQASNSHPQEGKPQIDEHGRALGEIDVLSDPRGVDFGPYLQGVTRDVRLNWYNLIPSSARCPLARTGTVSIEFAIDKHGHVAAIKLADGGSSGDTKLDRAAWGAIAGSDPFPPLPKEFSGSYIALRFRFYYNPLTASEIGSDVPRSQGTPPSAIRVKIYGVPGDVQVPVGSSQLITAAVEGTTNQVLRWTVVGVGCSGSACGTVMDGLYIAPALRPDPPVVNVFAIAAADPSARACTTIHLVAAAPQN
jgi:TonB family protein